MGCGKSTVGRALAELLEFDFVDTDELVEARTQKRIADIFEQQGEAAFRKLETETLQDLEQRDSILISTGGGLPTQEGNLDRLKQHSLVVCLWASPERIYERVKTQTHRPLLHVPDPLQRIQDLLAERTPFYRMADVLISTDGRPIREVVQQVATQFRLAQKAAK